MLENPSVALTLVPFSKKQRMLMNWWCPNSPVKDYIGIICDGSIRAGKTLPMSLSFVMWAFTNFNGQNFAFCGKTIGALRRNVIQWLKVELQDMGYVLVDNRSDNSLTIHKDGKFNVFYMFGGRDESSQDLVQGVTLAGVLFDEVALMPESFINQATGRCSVSGSKLWFNCNPDGPMHWFKKRWLDVYEDKGLLHIHFTMDDNPSLSGERRKYYNSLYTGVFHKRYILGLWVAAEGLIYDMFTDENLYEPQEIPAYEYLVSTSSRYIAIDYGTQNAMAFLDIIDDGRTIWVHDEYYYDGRKVGVQKTDSQYADDLDAFTKDKDITYVVIDPSAASFKAELRNRGYRIKEAKREDLAKRGSKVAQGDKQRGDGTVLYGIRLTATLIGLRLIRVNKICINLLMEFKAYVWDLEAADRGKEQPLKKNDHALDALRYFNYAIYKTRRLKELYEDNE